MQIKTKVLTTTDSQGLNVTQQGNARKNINAQQKLATDDGSHIELVESVDAEGNPVTKIGVVGEFGKIYESEDQQYLEVDNTSNTIGLSTSAKAKLDRECTVKTADPVIGDGSAENPINVRTMVGTMDKDSFEEEVTYNLIIEDNVYPVVRLGDVLWMCKPWKAKETEGVVEFYPDNDESNINDYGVLYMQSSLMNMQFPAGWHIPTEENAQQLLTHFHYGPQSGLNWAGNTYEKDGKTINSSTDFVATMKIPLAGDISNIVKNRGTPRQFGGMVRMWCQNGIDYGVIADYGYGPGTGHIDNAFSVILCREFSGTSGLVPAPSDADTGKFLRGDGTWQTVPVPEFTGDTYVNVDDDKITTNVATPEETADIFDEE